MADPGVAVAWIALAWSVLWTVGYSIFDHRRARSRDLQIDERQRKQDERIQELSEPHVSATVQRGYSRLESDGTEVFVYVLIKNKGFVADVISEATLTVMGYEFSLVDVGEYVPHEAPKGRDLPAPCAKTFYCHFRNNLRMDPHGRKAELTIAFVRSESAKLVFQLPFGAT